MSNIDSDRYDLQRQSAFILQQLPYESLLRVNRLLYFVIFSLMIVILLLGYFLIPKNDLINTLKNNQATVDVHNVSMNPAVSSEIKILKRQMVGLISGSIESKLRTLEQSIDSGKTSPADLGLILDLKDELKMLQTISETKEFNSHINAASKSRNITSELLFREVTQLKTLIYFTIASCGLMVAGIGGVWLQNRLMIEHEVKNNSNKSR